MKQLQAELGDVRGQIRAEASKILKGLDNEAEVAAARETSLRNSLNEVKTQASGLSEAEIKLRALEREAKAQRDLLESYLARYRDASARHDMGAVPAQAAIVSRAHASILPSFPKKLPISLLVAAAVALLSLAYVLARELIAAPAAGSEPANRSAARSRRRVAPPEEPEAPAAAPRHVAAAPREEPPPLVETKTAPVLAETPPLSTPAEPAATSSGSGFFARLRRNTTPAPSEPAPPASEGWLARVRRSRTPEPTRIQPAASEAMDEAMPLKTNDLRHYLNQRLAAAAEPTDGLEGNGKVAEPKAGAEKIGPVLRSLDAVVNHVVAAGRGGAPRALLVAGAAANVDSAREAIAVARALAERRERIVLVDLSRGAASVSGPLELPRSPGLTDLLAGRSSFEDVVKLDPKTPLQIIPAGNPKLAAGGDENERFTRVFEALTQAYDCVALHADLDTVRKFMPALKFELPVAVAVLPTGDNGETKPTDFSSLGCPVLVYEQDRKTSRRGLFGRVATI
jgi:hypothetical protein